MSASARTAVLAAMLALTGCAALREPPTPYGPRVDVYGYSEAWIRDRDWRVAFAGNAETPRETIEAYALRRATALTRSRGFPRFAVLKRSFRSEILRGEQTVAADLAEQDLALAPPIRPAGPPGTQIVRTATLIIRLLGAGNKAPADTLAVHDAAGSSGRNAP